MGERAGLAPSGLRTARARSWDHGEGGIGTTPRCRTGRPSTDVKAQILCLYRWTQKQTCVRRYGQTGNADGHSRIPALPASVPWVASMLQITKRRHVTPSDTCRKSQEGQDLNPCSATPPHSYPRCQTRTRPAV